MIDIHSHILPWVDDGAKDIAMSIDMAKMYLDNGITKVIATPHYIEGSRAISIEENIAALEELRKELLKEKLEIEIFLGNEVYISPNMLENIDNKKVCTLNNTRYVLIELPMNDIPIYVENVIYTLLIEGYVPIIAHPERNIKIMEDPNILYNYISKGALAQLNLPSLEGLYGNKVMMTAEILLKHQMIHFVGTDAHTNRMRSPNVQEALKILMSIVGRQSFQKFTCGNSKLLLENKIIDINPPMKYETKMRRYLFLSKLKKS